MASARRTQEALDAGNFEQATSLWSQTEYVIMIVAHDIDFYNILKEIPYDGLKKHISKKKLHSYEFEFYIIIILAKLFKPSTRDEEDDKLEYIMNSLVRQALNLTRTWGAQSNAVFSNLRGDFMKPVTEISNFVQDFPVSFLKSNNFFSGALTQYNRRSSFCIQWTVRFDCRYTWNCLLDR